MTSRPLAQKCCAILQAQIDADSVIVSDDGGSRIGQEFPRYESINHSIGEYVRNDAHNSTIESDFCHSEARYY